MSLLEEISEITIRNRARHWKPRLSRYEGQWVCCSGYPMRSSIGRDTTLRGAYEAWVRVYPDLIPQFFGR